MAPKLQSKTLETKAQTCPLYEATLPQKAVAESSGQAVPEDLLTPVSEGSTISRAYYHSSNVWAAL